MEAVTASATLIAISVIQLDAAEDVEDHEGAEMFILPTSETRVLVRPRLSS